MISDVFQTDSFKLHTAFDFAWKKIIANIHY